LIPFLAFKASAQLLIATSTIFEPPLKIVQSIPQLFLSLALYHFLWNFRFSIFLFDYAKQTHSNSYKLHHRLIHKKLFKVTDLFRYVTLHEFAYIIGRVEVYIPLH
jgi:uncharacterized membrane protein